MRNMKRWLAVLMSATVAMGGAGVTQLSTVAAYAAETGTETIAEDTRSIEWSSDYSTVTIDKTEFSTKKTWMGDGTIKVEPDKVKKEIEGQKLPSTENVVCYYVDFSSSKLVYEKNGTVKDLNGSTWKFSNATALLSGDDYSVKLKLVKPSSIKNGADVVVDLTNNEGKVGNWKISVTVKPKELDKNSEKEQTLEYSVDTTWDGTGDNKVSNGKTQETAKRLGAVPSAKVTVQKSEKPTFYYDSVDKDNEAYNDDNMPTYDGAEHKIVSGNADGKNVSYSVYNPKTGQYDAASNVTIKHVQEKDIEVTPKYTEDGKTVEADPLKVNLKPAKVEFGFDMDASLRDYEVYYQASKGVYNISDYITVKAASKKDVASKKAVAADEKALKEFFNEVYTVEVTKRKNAGVDFAYIKVSDDFDKNKVKEKYAELIRDYAFDVDEMSYYLDEDTRAAEIDLYENIALYIDNVQAVQGKTPALKYTVKTEDGKIFTNFNKSLLKFTTVGGDALNTLKPGTYKLAATAEGYEVEVKGLETGTYGVLTVNAALKASKISKVALAKNTFKAATLKKKNQYTKLKVTKTGNGKLTFKKTSGSKYIVVNKAGKVGLKKGLKKGTYKFKVKVKIAKTSKYKAATKTVTLKIKVK